MIENYYVAEYLMKRHEDQLNHPVHSSWKTFDKISPPRRSLLTLFSILPKKQEVCCSAAVCC